MRKGRRVPKLIDQDEVIVRAVIYPMHLKKLDSDNLKPFLFRPRTGTDEISVMRRIYMTDDLCKRRAKILQFPPDSQFTGFAVFRAACVSDANAKIIDSRCEYLGHADIKYGVNALPRDEPASAATNMKLDRMVNAILNDAIYVRDDDPSATHWTGPCLTTACRY